ncbi:MAG: GNAT family N-acetyltransferase [Planctomycetales bacterium]|nr:GNAT family N-acetyltransferase [Planctomycetales bacterium]
MTAVSSSPLAVQFEPTFDPPPAMAATPALVDNFNHFQRHSKPATELSWAVLREAGAPVAAAPVVRLRRRAVTDMLVPPWRRRLGWLGPVIRKTTLLVDTAFLAYDETGPFQIAAGFDRTTAKRAIADFLCRQKKIDTVWISERPDEAAWAAADKWDQFSTLPMTSIDLSGIATFDDYLAGLSKKRRRNYRHESQVFADAGAVVEIVEGPLVDRPQLVAELTHLLAASESHSELVAPYNDVLIDPQAFAEQRQTALIARVDGRAVGFMCFLQAGERWMQCHGGLDYARSHEVLAYHNLIYAGVRTAIERGCRAMTMGPLNNETKRRAATDLHPVVASVWNRWPADRLVASKFLFPKFGVYYGPIGDPLAAAAGD